MNPPFREHSLLDYWLASIAFGLYGLRRPHLREAVARIVNPMSYPRLLEYQVVFGLLGRLAGKQVLDIGSPKLPALLFARRGEFTLYVSDIRDYFIRPTRHLLRHAGLGGRVGREIQLQVEDARKLTFADESLDAIYSISVIEHIPGEGDAEAMSEFGRVLRPGARVAITVPYTFAGYHEDWVRSDVYERKAAGEDVFYQRHYDDASLASRLVEPSRLDLAAVVYFGEPRIRFERYWNRIPMRLKLPLLWVQPFLATCLLRRLPAERRDRACGVAILLVKPFAGESDEGPPSLPHGQVHPIQFRQGVAGVSV